MVWHLIAYVKIQIVAKSETRNQNGFHDFVHQTGRFSNWFTEDLKRIAELCA